MQEINTVGYSLFFVLPAVAILIGVVMLVVPRRRETRLAGRETHPKAA
jgi:cytochrome c-type biogenesis protein CcmH/NrfF